MGRFVRPVRTRRSTCRIRSRYIFTTTYTYLASTLGTCRRTIIISTRTGTSCTRTSIIYCMCRLIISRAYTSTCRIRSRYICTASTTYLTTTCSCLSCCRVVIIATRTIVLYSTTTICRTRTLTLTCTVIITRITSSCIISAAYCTACTCTSSAIFRTTCTCTTT